MRYVKFLVLALGALGVVLSLMYSVLSAGFHGVVVVAGCALPAGLAAYGTFAKPTMPRWAAVVSAISFLIVGMKTTESGPDIENIMLAAFFGIIVSAILAIRPERSAARP